MTCSSSRLRAMALIILIVATALGVGSAHAAGDARALAMGGAQTAVARGVDAARWNPASLAFSPGTSVGLAGVSADLDNNSFTLGRYNEFSGAVLSTADKQRLLADIPAGGFRLDAEVSAGALGVQVGPFALTTGAVGAGSGNLDRDFFDLVLFGNALGQTVDFSDTWGEGYAIGHASLSYGHQVLSGPFGRIAVGATASYLQGIYELHVEEAYGSLSTGMMAISGEAYVSAVTAEGGAGYGLDLGAAWQAPGGWSVGLAVDNVVANLDWSGTVERTELRVSAAEVNAVNDDLDGAVAHSDTTYAIDGYSTSLPRRLRLGAAHDGGTWLVAADYVQGLDDRAGTTTAPRLNVGTEWRALGWLTPRAGLSLATSGGTGIAGGLGFQAAFWQLDLAVMNRGGFSSSSTKGLGFGVSTRFVF